MPEIGDQNTEIKICQALAFVEKPERIEPEPISDL